MVTHTAKEIGIGIPGLLPALYALIVSPSVISLAQTIISGLAIAVTIKLMDIAYKEYVRKKEKKDD